MTEKQYHHGDLKNALIEAGIEILSSEGLHALSLRKTALKAGVSHAAPYAHFPDKQALIAAIASEGFRRLQSDLTQVIEHHADNPQIQLMEGAWTYVEFARHHPDVFKVMFSSALAKEKDHPALVEAARQTFNLVVQIVEANQAAGKIKPGSPDLMAVSIWSAVHGLCSLLLEEQISHTVTARFTLREMLEHTLSPYAK